MCLLHGPTPVTAAAARAEQMLAEADANAALQANVRTALAELKAMQKSFDEAHELLAAARRTYEELGLRLALVGLMQVEGLVELLAGDAEEAEHAFRSGFDLIAVEFPTWRVYQSGLLADALYEQRRLDEARELVESASPDRLDDLETILPWAMVKSRLLARDGHLEEGEELLRDIAARASQTDALNTHGHVLLALAEVLHIAQRTDDARTAAAEAADIFARKGNVPAAERATALLAEPARR
jgi:tetratricopeptide (TPR) repeat protein